MGTKLLIAILSLTALGNLAFADEKPPQDEKKASVRKVASHEPERNSPFQIVCAMDVQGLQKALQTFSNTPIRAVKTVSAPAMIGDKVCITVQFED